MSAAAEAAPAVLTLAITEEQLRAIIVDAVRQAMKTRVVRNEHFDTVEAAKYLGISATAVRSLVFRERIVPDHRGGQDGLKGNRFSKATLDGFLSRKR